MNEHNFKKINVNQIKDNFFKSFADEWMLLCAGKKDNYNMMTAAWGNIGILWNKPVAICYVRPQRFTYRFMETNSHFTINFFPENYKDVLELCGTKSGKDINKMKIDKLTPIETVENNVIFNESRLAIECKKIYFDDIKPENFVDQSFEKLYIIKDYHRLYIGEIINVFKSK